MKDRSPRILFVLAVAALTTPVAAATWYVQGSHEPDNALDVPTLMFFDPAAPGEHKIYFNVVEGIGPGVRGVLISPNVGLLQTTHTTPVMEGFTAVFGVWIDCNGDGYVGLAESALREYPAELLLDDSACSPENGPTNEWTPGAHNYNGWVSELVPIGGIAGAFTGDEGELRVYRDEGAMVWGDPGKPTDPASVGGSCPLAPQPRGAYQSTGGFLNYVGCLSGAINRWNEVLQGRRIAGQDVDGVEDYAGPTGLAFPGGSASGSWADHPTFGSEDTRYSPVHVWDCSAEPAFHSGQTINETFGADAATIHMLGDEAGVNTENFFVYSVAPEPGNVGTGSTAPALVNDTQEGLENCDTSDDSGHDFYGNNYVFYVGETDFAPVSGANKTAAQFNFQFQQWGRGLNPLGLDCVTFEDAPCDIAAWPTIPVWGGPSGMALPAGEFSNYNPGSVSTTAGVPNRYALVDASEGSASLPGAAYFSWYAHVSSATTSRGFGMPGGVGAYGQAQCGENTIGIYAGWNCQADLWYHNPDGSPQPEPQPLARVGQVYEFRDVDCYDGHVGPTGVAIGTAAYGAAPCGAP